MKILMATYGSRGDVAPFTALGKGLQRSGHQVALATSCRFKDEILAQGLSYRHMGDDLLALVDSDLGKQMIDQAGNPAQGIRLGLKLKKLAAPLQKALVWDAWKAARSESPDLILFHPKVFAAPAFAEKLEVPCILALPFPMLVPTNERPHAGFPDPGLGCLYNRATHALVNSLVSLAAKPLTNAWRRAHGLAPVRWAGLLRHADGRPVPVFNAFSPQVVAPPQDQPRQVFTTGYWFPEPPPDYRPPARLRDFLDQGSAPVYVGFGSMTGKAPGRLAALAVAALERAGARGILATGWGGLAPGSLPKTILAIDQAPHAWLFPRMAAIVHHGGAGTTGAALRAGRPSVIIPFFGDQPFWGKRVHALGAGTAPIPRPKLTVENLARAITLVLKDPAIGRSARHLGNRLARENGVQTAVQLIHRIKRIKTKEANESPLYPACGL